MKRIALYCFLLLCPALQRALADPVSLTINPPFQVAFTGSVAVVQVAISNLGGANPQLGAFDLVLTYDPTILTLNSVTFGQPVFGDQLNLSGFGSATLINESVPGRIELAEISFDSANTIDTLQESSFILATIDFTVATAGTTALGLSNVTLADALGNSVPVSPANIVGGSLLATTGTGVSEGTCAVSAASVPTVRIEGTTEVVGSLLLTCGPGINAVPVVITVTLQPATANFSPTSRSPDNMATFPLPTMTTNLPSAGTRVSGLAVVTSGNTASFAFVPIPSAQTFNISGLRVNLASSGLADGSSVGVTLAATPAVSGQLTFQNPSVLIALAHRGLAAASGFNGPALNIFSCAPALPAPAGAPALIPANPDTSAGLTNSVQLMLTQGFPGAWQVAAGEEGGLGGLQGTRFMITLTGIPGGFVVYAPVNPTSGSVTLSMVSSANPDGSGGTLLNAPGNFGNVAISGSTAVVVYEVSAVNTTVSNSLTIPIALTGAQGSSLGTVQGSFSFAPVGPPTLSPALPQFAAPYATTTTVATSLPCLSYLLFPWVVYTADGQLDTGITVSNTTADTPDIGTVAEQGAVTLYFWSNSATTQPAPVTISPSGGLTAGQTATFMLSELGVAFQGYVFAECHFLLAHGIAFIDSPQNGRGRTIALAVVVTDPRLGGGAAPTESGLH